MFFLHFSLGSCCSCSAKMTTSLKYMRKNTAQTIENNIKLRKRPNGQKKFEEVKSLCNRVCVRERLLAYSLIQEAKHTKTYFWCFCRHTKSYKKHLLCFALLLLSFRFGRKDQQYFLLPFFVSLLLLLFLFFAVFRQQFDICFMGDERIAFRRKKFVFVVFELIKSVFFYNIRWWHEHQYKRRMIAPCEWFMSYATAYIRYRDHYEIPIMCTSAIKYIIRVSILYTWR